VPGGVTVGTLLGSRGAAAGLALDLLAGASGLDREITLPYIQKTGLALAGFDEYLRTGRVLILGESEIRFLERMDAADRARNLRSLFARDFPCMMITMGLDGPNELLAHAAGNAHHGDLHRATSTLDGGSARGIATHPAKRKSGQWPSCALAIPSAAAKPASRAADPGGSCGISRLPRSQGESGAAAKFLEISCTEVKGCVHRGVSPRRKRSS